MHSFSKDNNVLTEELRPMPPDQITCTPEHFISPLIHILAFKILQVSVQKPVSV